MDFQFYFLKEDNRVYDNTELIALLRSNPCISMEKRLEDKIFTYRHPELNFDARFIMSSRSKIPHLERLSPKYFDINFMVEFNVLLPTYCVELILDIVEDICKTMKFYVYNQAFQDVNPFKRQMMIKAFDAWKKAYKDNHEDEIAKYKYLSSQNYSLVLGYLAKRPELAVQLDKSKYYVPEYDFLYTARSRACYVTISWDGYSQLVLPPAVDIFYYNDGKDQRFIPFTELISKTDKLFSPLDEFGYIRILDNKNVKKLKRFINKNKFSPLNAELKTTSIDNILDV